jgi:hypothetical protein
MKLKLNSKLGLWYFFKTSLSLIQVLNLQHIRKRLFARRVDRLLVGRIEVLSVGRVEGLFVVRFERLFVGKVEVLFVGMVEGLFIRMFEGLFVGRVEGLFVGRVEWLFVGSVCKVLELVKIKYGFKFRTCIMIRFVNKVKFKIIINLGLGL